MAIDGTAALLFVVSILLSVIAYFGQRMYVKVMDGISPALDRLSRSHYGDAKNESDTGLIGDVEEISNQIEAMSRNRRREHEQVQQRLEGLQERVDRLRGDVNHMANRINRDDALDINVDVGDRKNNRGGAHDDLTD